ncbi:MAG TPA: sugar kinase [Alphaproteobacteria bacterium]|nr:sugar kinase [Alphaproteobacteria bacterium]
MAAKATALDILSFGEAMVEFNAAGPARDGATYVQGYGGDTSNVVIAAVRQGARAGYLTALGADLFGDALLELWRREGVDTTHVIRRDDAATGIYFVTHDRDGHQFTYYRAGSAASRVTPADVSAAAIAGARILHLSGISQAISESAAATAAEAIAQARAHGVKVSYDPNLRLKLWPLARARAVIDATVALADIVLPSLEDARTLTGREGADEILDHYLGLGAPLVALKLGREGCLIGTAQARRRLPGHRVQTVDATGAGDAFVGAFLARLAMGDNPLAAAAYANAAAALSTTGYGAVAPIPSRAAVERLLAEAGSRVAS